MNFRAIIVIPVLLFLAGFSEPVTSTDDLKKAGIARVTEIVDGDTLFLDAEIDGSRQVRLVGLQAPKLPLGRKGFKEWPLAPDSKFALEELTLGKTVELRYGGSSMDRHGRLLAHLFLEDGTWVQGKMLLRGMARVYSFPDNRSVVDEMLQLERQARAEKRGIWAHPFYSLRQATPDSLNSRIGTFQVIEGKIVAAAKVKSTIYLNFDKSWRTDFTVTLDNNARKMFSKLGIDPLSIEGRDVRVRGWLKKRNGPAITLTHPEQIELLE